MKKHFCGEIKKCSKNCIKNILTKEEIIENKLAFYISVDLGLVYRIINNTLTHRYNTKNEYRIGIVAWSYSRNEQQSILYV